jgi:ABC-type multidrug transport system fused ATPase/permease subunit
MQGETSANAVQVEAVAQTSAHPHHHTGSLFHHEPHPHKPRNVNVVHNNEKAAEGINTKIAILLTNSVGSMWTAYLFVVIAIVGLFAILGVFSPLVALLVAWASQTLIQLVLLPVIMVGQNVLNRKAELQAEEQFNTTMSTYHDIEQIMQHLVAQDTELLRHARMLEHLLEKNGITLQQVEKEVGQTSHLEMYAKTLPANTSAENEQPSA